MYTETIKPYVGLGQVSVADDAIFTVISKIFLMIIFIN